MDIPEGWYYEQGDASVGIFGELFIHECGTDDRPNETEAELKSTNLLSATPITMTWEEMYICPNDGEVGFFIRRTPFDNGEDH